jgi:enoyl-[acyl-carrier protein] reductase II
MMNKICELFNLKYPIIQAGMVWCSGWKLASAVSDAGGLGLIGSGSMDPDLLREHIRDCKKATDRPFGVNVPLIYRHAEENIKVILNEGIDIVFTSAGNPARFTPSLKRDGIKVAHVIANKKFALKSIEAGVDALVCEGFEAGGHNGIEETTTMVLVPLIRKITELPLIAAGGIADGRSMLASMALGADGVQVGSRFAASVESSASDEFKRIIIEAGDGDTILAMKKLVPVRMLKNKFYQQVKEMEDKGSSKEELRELLGSGRSRRGMFEGDLEEGELEIGQVSSIIDAVLPAKEIIKNILAEFESARREMSNKY